MPADPSIAIVVDADACVPEPLRNALGIITAPREAPPLLERETIPRLRIEAGPTGADVPAEVCAEAASEADVALYIAVGDGYGGAAGAADQARAAVEARAPGTEFLALETGQALMGAGWQAVALARAVRAGVPPRDAIERVAPIDATTTVLAALEHPELTDASGIATLGAHSRAVVALRGEDVEILHRPNERDRMLITLRDRFAALVPEEGQGRAHVAVHHAGSGPAAEAMARWIERERSPAEVIVAPLTRHAATRLGPRMVGLAWYLDATEDR